MELQPRDGADLRGLKALVGVMGALVILGTAVVIGVVIHRIYAKSASPSIIAATPNGLAGPISLFRGEHVAGIAGTGQDFAVWVSGPGGDRILLIDPQSQMVSVAVVSAKQ